LLLNIPNRSTVAITSAKIIATATFIRLNILEEYDYIINFYREQVSAQSPKIFNIVLLIAVNIAVGIFFAKCISSAINRHSASAWVFTLMTSICALALITSTVMAQFDIEFSSAIISTIYILVSIILISSDFKDLAK
jgi:ABC-type multidrug transport system permease subunit